MAAARCGGCWAGGCTRSALPLCTPRHLHTPPPLPPPLQVLAGTNDDSALVYDLGAGRVSAKLGGHTNDVNAVTYLGSSPHVFATGSDDSLVLVRGWGAAGRGAAGMMGVGLLLGMGLAVQGI